jgi:hypothetical protein
MEQQSVLQPNSVFMDIPINEDQRSGHVEHVVDNGLLLIQVQIQPLVLVSPPSQNSVRCSIHLKVKGLNGSASKTLSQAITGSSIMAQFSFSRFTHDEIFALFRSFRVQLGKDDSQRDIIISRFQNMQ